LVKSYRYINITYFSALYLEIVRFCFEEKNGITSFTSAAESVSMVAVHTDTTEASESVKAICVGVTAVLVHSAFVYI